LGSASGGSDPIAIAGDAHLATIAPLWSGQDRSCLIPNLLNYPGPAVVVDVDGGAYAATAQARRAMGQAIVRLDPFGVTGPGPDALDPFGLLGGLAEPAVTSRCLDIAGLLLPMRHPGGDGADGEAFGLLSGMIGYVHAAPGLGTFDALYQAVHEEDFGHSIAVALDTTGKHLSKPSYSELQTYVARDEWLRTRILATLRSGFEGLGIPEVRRCTGRSTVPPSAMRAGEPVTVYLVLPADQVATHSVLLRLWAGTLLLAAAGPRAEAVLPTLFLLDRCADLGAFPLLESLLTLRPGGATRIWTFWHDVHQLRTAYPGSWREIVSGCGAVQVFATRDAAAAAEAEALLGLEDGDVWSLGPADQVLGLDGTHRRARRLAR
jgi:type IV secretion system protein VirD4